MQVDIFCFISVKLIIDGVNYPIRWYPSGGISWLFDDSLYIGVYDDFKPYIYRISGNYNKLPNEQPFDIAKQSNKQLLCSSTSNKKIWNLDKYNDISLADNFWSWTWMYEGQLIMKSTLTTNLLKWLRVSPFQTDIHSAKDMVPYLLGILILSTLD